MRNLRQSLERPAGKYVALGVVLFLACVLFSAHAQYGGRRQRGFGRRSEYGNPQRAREQEIMQKALDPGFTEDVFTFARLKFDSEYGGYGPGRTWNDDS